MTRGVPTERKPGSDPESTPQTPSKSSSFFIASTINLLRVQSGMLKAGELAPNFTALDDQGHSVTLNDLLQQGPLLLFFYPGDFTPMCTAQACGLRDSYASLADAGLRVAGINPGSQGSHAKFRERYKLPYPLLVDQGKAAAKAFGVGSYLGLTSRRASFLIDTDLRVIEAIRADLSLTAHDEFIARCVQWSINRTQQS